MSEIGSSAREYRQLRRSALWPDRGAPEGRGRTVVVVPGFGNPAAAIAPLARWLRSGGWDAVVPRLGFNVGCGTAAVEVVADAVREGARSSTLPVAIVGHSRGGLLGRVAAVREGDQVDRLVTVCTPWSIEPPARPGVAATTRAVQAVRRRGWDVLGSVDCAAGSCCTDFRTEMEQTPAADWTALWSSTDTIGAELSRPPAAADRSVDLRTSHLGGVLSVPGWQAIATALSG
jgi:pimeloyl-ACP methyl ester carboxylesterase